jgi:hypothetical protein
MNRATGGEGEAVVREVEASAVGQDVLKMGVEVQQSASVHEGGAGFQ